MDWVCSIVIRLWGVLLLLSAVAKANAPWAAWRALTALGAGSGMADAGVVGSTALEAGVGLCCMIWPNMRASRVLAFVSGLAALLAACVLAIAAEHCGCFGDYEVPLWLRLALAGFTLSMGNIASPTPSRCPPAHLPMLLAATLAAAMASWAQHRLCGDGNATAWLPRCESSCAALVATPGCPDCQAAERELAQRSLRITWVVALGDADQVRAAGKDAVVEVPRDVWWGLRRHALVWSWNDPAVGWCARP